MIVPRQNNYARHLNIQSFISIVYRIKFGFQHRRARVAGDPTVTISNRENYGLPGGVEDGPELILMHEIVGHAVPILSGNMNGNAVEDENKVRKELNIPLRLPEPKHLESNFGG